MSKTPVNPSDVIPFERPKPKPKSQAQEDREWYDRSITDFNALYRKSLKASARAVGPKNCADKALDTACDEITKRTSQRDGLKLIRS